MQQIGYDSSGIRRFNERLILTALGKHGACSKTELAKLTNLTSQGVMRIVNELKAQGLVKFKTKRITGKGRPSELMDLDPKGAYSIGVMIGRREIKIILMSIVGKTLAEFQQAYDYPDPFRVIEVIEQALVQLLVNLNKEERQKLKGIGIAMPWFLGRWSDGKEMPKEIGDIWENIDFPSLLESKLPYPVMIANDCSAAAGAELLYGKGRENSSFLYIYIDSFIGGGIVINGNLHQGIRSNAAALASYPVSHSTSPHLAKGRRPFEILLNRSSLMSLIDFLNYHQHSIDNLHDLQVFLDTDLASADQWIDDCSEALAELVISYVAMLDLDTVFIDINLNGPIISRIIEKTSKKVASFIERDLDSPIILQGSLGKSAIVRGGAILPIYSNFIADKSVVFKNNK